MVGTSTAVYTLIASLFSTIIIVLVALGISIARTREKVVKLEEWVRIQEKKQSDSH